MKQSPLRLEKFLSIFKLTFSLQQARSGKLPMARNTTTKLLQSSNLTFFAESLSIKFFGDTILEKQPKTYLEAVREDACNVNKDGNQEVLENILMSTKMMINQ